MSFNTEKNVPVVNFIADSTKRATGLYGPEALLEALTEIVKMFDVESIHSDNITHGGISINNLASDLKNLVENSVQKREGYDLSECNYSPEERSSLNECVLAKHTHNYDNNPTENSNNLLTSGAVYNMANLLKEFVANTYLTKSNFEIKLEDYAKNFVQKRDGYDLSECNYSSEERSSLNECVLAKHTHTYDDLPTPNSNNLLTSGAIYNAINSLSPFVINGTADYVGGELSSTTFDKSYQEVKEAIDYGVSPIVNVDIKYNGITRQSIILNFKGYMGSSIIFSSVTMNADIDVLFGKSGNASFSFKILKEYNEKATTWDDNYYDDEVLYLTPKAMVDFFNSKIPEFKGYNSLSYFFASNYNNDLFGAVETSGALFADYIFKQNSMSDISIDLSNCYSMIGGFLNSEVENVTFINETPKLTKAQNLFRGCRKLTNVTGLDLTNVDSCKYMFYGCEGIVIVSEGLILNGDCSYMFYGCSSLTSVNIDCTNLTNGTGIFTGCSMLSDITLIGDPDYTTIFNSLENVESGTIKVDDVSTISDEVKAIATGKGWTIE